MASWQDVQQFVLSNYKVSQDIGQGMKLEFETFSGRTQLVFLTRAVLEETEEWVMIESPFAKQGEVDLQRLLVAMSGLVCGGLGLFGEDMLAFRHSAPLANLDPNELVRPMQLITNMADAYEFDITGQDRF